MGQELPGSVRRFVNRACYLCGCHGFGGGLEEAQDFGAFGGFGGMGGCEDGPAAGVVVKVEGKLDAGEFAAIAKEGGVGLAAQAAKDEDVVGDAGEAKGGIDFVEGILTAFFDGVVDDEDGDAVLVGKRLDGFERGVVFAVEGGAAGAPAHFGEGVDDDEAGVGVALEPEFEEVKAAFVEAGPVGGEGEGGRWVALQEFPGAG